MRSRCGQSRVHKPAQFGIGRFARRGVGADVHTGAPVHAVGDVGTHGDGIRAVKRVVRALKAHRLERRRIIGMQLPQCQAGGGVGPVVRQAEQ